MPDLKCLYRALYIIDQLITLFKQSLLSRVIYILIIEYTSVITIVEWLDGSFEIQSRL
jgi:hypothetical protein